MSDYKTRLVTIKKIFKEYKGTIKQGNRKGSPYKRYDVSVQDENETYTINIFDWQNTGAFVFGVGERIWVSYKIEENVSDGQTYKNKVASTDTIRPYSPEAPDMSEPVFDDVGESEIIDKPKQLDHWERKELKDDAKQPKIIRQHSQEMANQAMANWINLLAVANATGKDVSAEVKELVDLGLDLFLSKGLSKTDFFDNDVKEK